MWVVTVLFPGHCLSIYFGNCCVFSGKIGAKFTAALMNVSLFNNILLLQSIEVM